MKYSDDKIETVEIDLSTRCNARCPLCMRQTERFARKYSRPYNRSADEILAQLSGFRNLKHVYLIGQMSEPTLHPQFLEIASTLKDRGMTLKICTNGSVHAGDFWTNLGHMLTPGDRVWFGICGSSQEMHGKYRIGTELSRILGNAKALRSTGRFDGAKCIRFAYNEEDLASRRFLDMVSEFSFVEFTETCMPDDVNNQNPDFLPCKAVIEKFRKLESVCCMMNRIHPGNTCQSMFENSVQIDPFGEVFPCYRFVESNDSWDGDYDGILNGRYDVCRFCNSKTLEYIDRNGLNSII